MRHRFTHRSCRGEHAQHPCPHLGFRTYQDSAQSRKIPHRQHDSVSHREGNCIAFLRAKREPGARETMREALRQLTQQVREDDSLH
jgi:hypothetical protein